jgi:hypothetical protein
MVRPFGFLLQILGGEHQQESKRQLIMVERFFKNKLNLRSCERVNSY